LQRKRDINRGLKERRRKATITRKQIRVPGTINGKKEEEKKRTTPARGSSGGSTGRRAL